VEQGVYVHWTSVSGPKSLSAALRLARERANLTQSQLADRVGLAPSHIARLETGDRLNPRFETIARIAAELGASLDEIAIAAGFAVPVPPLEANRSQAVRSAQALRDLRVALESGSSIIDEAATTLDGLTGTGRARRSRPRR
jgi:transcriptional regulator with XRE-family HTH domain